MPSSPAVGERAEDGEKARDSGERRVYSVHAGLWGGSGDVGDQGRLWGAVGDRGRETGASDMVMNQVVA